MPENMQDIVSRVAAQALGVPQPGAPQPGAAPPQPGVAPPTPQQTAKVDPAKVTTDREAIEQSAQPKTEGDKQNEAPVVYKVKGKDGKERELTDTQIVGMMERYTALNQTHAQMKPLLNILGPMIEKGLKPEQLQAALESVVKGVTPNPVIGKDTDGKNDEKPAQPGTQVKAVQLEFNDDLVNKMGAWEEENGMTMPPGYREGAQHLAWLTNQVATLSQAVQQLVAMGAGQHDAARTAVQGATQMAGDARANMLRTNLNRVQQELTLPDESAQQFMQFAAQRGYTVEDFFDYDLLKTVATDFKNNTGAPDADRMRQVLERRQAMTGSVGTVPGAGSPAGATPPNPAQTTFDRLVDGGLQRAATYNMR